MIRWCCLGEPRTVSIAPKKASAALDQYADKSTRFVSVCSLSILLMCYPFPDDGWSMLNSRTRGIFPSL